MAAVTFSGFNNIDFNAVVDAIMTQESQPLSRLQSQKTTLDTQGTAFGALAARLTALKSAVDALKSDTSVSGLSATSSDTGVGVSATAGSVQGTYDVVVSQLARRQVTASSNTYPAATDVIATGGSLTLTAGDGTATIIPIGASTTVAGLVDAINGKDDAPVTASLVQSSPNKYQIVLTGKETGASNAFTVASALSGGAGISFADVDSNGVIDNVQDARNASFTVNNLAVTSASNVVSDVVPGVTLTLQKEAPATTITVSVAQDTSATKERVTKLVSAYNDLVTFLGDQRTAAASGKPSIGRDPLVRQVRDAFRSAVFGEYSNSGSYLSLPEVGIGFDITGKMTLDSKALDRALASSADLQTLFSGDSGTEGAFGAISTLIEGYTQAGGLVSDARDRLTQQTKSLTKRMDALQAQLDRRRLVLQQEYAAADQAMTQLNSQIQSLTSLNSQYRLF